MHLTLQEPEIDGVSMLIGIDEVVVQRRTAAGQELLIAETSAYGRTLFLDGLVQSAEADEALYHEPLVHPALVIHGAPRRVLVGGTGEGASIREVLRHPTVEHVRTVDLDPEVVALCKQHLPAWSAGSLDDPRVEQRVEDVQATLAAARPGEYDAVFLDITDPVRDGPSAALFSTRFFAAVLRALADDGIAVLQAGELDPIDLRMTRTVRSTLQAVFPAVTFAYTYVPSFHCLWSFALCSRRPLDAAPPDLEARIARLGKLRVYTPTAHRAMLELPPYLQERLAQPGEVLTDDGPRLSYTTGP
jgi:spermidine synthase